MVTLRSASTAPYEGARGCPPGNGASKPHLVAPGGPTTITSGSVTGIGLEGQVA